MLSIYFFIAAVICCFINLAYRRNWHCPQSAEVLLGYLLLFNVGLFGLLSAYGHVFMGPEIAAQIGWAAHSPFQFEIGMANLAFGVLGVLAFWIRGRFWDATLIGWAILLLGCFVGHLMNYYSTGDSAPYNVGVFLWFNDLFLPLFALGTLYYIRLRNYEQS